MLEKLELSVCTLRQHRCAEWLHDLLDCDILSCELVFGGAAEGKPSVYVPGISIFVVCIPYETECAHANRLKVRISGQMLMTIVVVVGLAGNFPAYLEVYRNAVSKRSSP